ncbi:MAG: hypothetical protein HFH73_14380 [Lachnospiraceae bacterium]|jgi:hypothetical protein|nr:hypothetical protein [Lachnospiraceae bacterium]
MVHNFDTEIAEKYGLLEAILLTNIYYWTEKNRANNINCFDGNYWTYNSTRAFNELFPYVSERQIKNALKHLRDEGVLLTGNYNKSSYDRTLWYALSEKGLSIVQKCPMEGTKDANGKCSNVQPIPDNKPNNKPDETITVSNDTVCRTDVQRVIRHWNNLQDCGIKAVSRVSAGTKRYESLIARIKQYGMDNVLAAIDRIRDSNFLQGGSKKGWFITFDWFVLPNNFIKVLEGNYDNPPESKGRNEYQQASPDSGYPPELLEQLANESRGD